MNLIHLFSRSLDGKKSIGFGLFLIAAGSISPIFKEWAKANPEAAWELYGLTLTAVGGIIPILRKWRMMFAKPEEEMAIRINDMNHKPAVQAYPVNPPQNIFKDAIPLSEMRGGLGGFFKKAQEPEPVAEVGDEKKNSTGLMP